MPLYEQYLELNLASDLQIELRLSLTNKLNTTQLQQIQAQAQFLYDRVCEITIVEILKIIPNLLFCRFKMLDSIEVIVKPPLQQCNQSSIFQRGIIEFETQQFGSVDILFENEKFGIYLLNIKAGQSIPAHIHLQMEEHELVLDEGLMFNGEKIKPGSSYDWPKGTIHGYINQSAVTATVLCIDIPKFIPEDEIIGNHTSPLGSATPINVNYYQGIYTT